jgi:hypothetical protein
MASTVKGFAVRAIDTGHGRADPGHYAINFGKVLPATATASLFTVTGSIQASLVGVVSTVGSVAATHLSIGITGNNSIIAANGAATFAAVAVGSVFVLPTVLGGQLPAPVTGTGIASSVAMFEASNTIITLTTDATNTGAVTWILTYVPLFPKSIVTSIVNN